MVALAASVAAVAIPSSRDVVESLRTAAAARYLGARFAAARTGAIAGSASIGVRFETDGDDYRFAAYVDGNGNGVRTADITAGVDVATGQAERLGDKFPGVTFGLMPGYPDVDDVRGSGEDGVRFGRPRIATMSPDGTATSGTVYLHGRRSQYAVRILGTTGRVRVLSYSPAEGAWLSR